MGSLEELKKHALAHEERYGRFSEKEAMEISGHKTRAVFDRYRIVSDRRLKEMAGKLEVHLKTKDAERSGGEEAIHFVFG